MPEPPRPVQLEEAGTTSLAPDEDGVLVEADVLVEELSIDGMCGVY